MDVYQHDFTKGPVCTNCGRSRSQQEQDPVMCSAPNEKEQAVQPQIKTEVDQNGGSDSSPHEGVIPGLTSIVVVAHMKSYPLFHMTGNALGSVKEHTLLPFEIILVDNGSQIKMEPEKFLVDKVIRNEDNVGVSKAWNQGIRVSQGEYIVLLNNDALVFDNWLKDFQKALTKLDLVMATPMYGKPFARAVEARELRSSWVYPVPVPIEGTFDDFKDFSCVGFKRQMVRDLFDYETANGLETTPNGLFDERFFAYAEDSDLLRRMDQAGMKYASTKLVNTFHIIGATSNEIPETPKILNRSKDQFKEKYEQQVLPMAVEDHVAEAHNKADSNFIRTAETGDRVYFVEDKTAHWVRNPETLKALGGNLDTVKQLGHEEYLELEIGDPIGVNDVSKYKS